MDFRIPRYINCTPDTSKHYQICASIISALDDLLCHYNQPTGYDLDPEILLKYKFVPA